jgi:putative SOS response-associated peptidase YedK
MCGRFTRMLPWNELVALYRLTQDWERGWNAPPRYNIAPTEEVPFVTAGGGGGAHRLRLGRWWLVPWWAKELPRQPMFNARIETVATAPAFRDAWREKRCLVPADGFYEWTKNPADGGRDPWHIHLPDRAGFSFAGLWAHNGRLDVTSCTIVTAPAVEPMARLHDRQPVILDPAAYDAWLDPATPEGDLKDILARDLNATVQFHRVSREVNSTKGGADRPSMAEPVNTL